MKGHRKIFWTWPNILTLLRVVLITFAYFLGSDGQWLTVLIIAAIAALTDYFDGMLARKLECESVIGAALDPIADKAFVVGLLLLVNIYLAIVVLLLELIGSFFSNSVRKDKGGHYVGHGSKGITFFQMTFVAILICNRIPELSLLDNFEHELYGALAVLSLIRLFIYGSLYKEKRKEEKRNLL